MSAFAAALAVEALKARRSKLPWLTLAALALLPLMATLFMLILKDPQLAERLGLIGRKAKLASGEADWPSYLTLLAQGIAIGGFLVFGFITTWLFGREYTDQTLKDLLALPISRRTIVYAKLALAGAWTAALTVLVSALGLALAWGIALPGWSSRTGAHGIGDLALAAALTSLLTSWFAYAASRGRGYLPALGLLLLLLFLAQIVAATGWGAYFPWSIPALATGAAGKDQTIAPLGYALVILVSLAGALATVHHWDSADQR